MFSHMVTTPTRVVLYAVTLAALCCTTTGAASAQPGTQPCPPEPNAQVAATWWPEQRNVWTPLGWKDHSFRFNVLYNGSILFSPEGGYYKKHLEKYRGQDMQLTFAPSLNGSVPPLPAVPVKWYSIDGGVGDQAWDESHEAPILRTEWPRQDGVIIRQETFAHLEGGKKIETATEPLYAWIRLSVAHVDPVRAPKDYTISTQFTRLYTSNIYPFALDDSVTLQADPKLAPFKELLQWGDAQSSGNSAAHAITMADGKIRAIVFPNNALETTFTESADTAGIYQLKIKLPSKVGAYADLLVPFLPTEADTVNTEIELGRDGALAQAEEYWSQKPDTAARIHTPEHYINEALRRNIQFAQLITERNTENKTYTFMSGSFGYDALWSTPSSMISHMFLDLLGYHDFVDTHIDLLRQYQGTVKPPGPAYEIHPGYLATPEFLTTFDWLADHGANMEASSRHALLTADPEFIEKWTTPTVAACDFIMNACAIQTDNGIAGLLPPGSATDTSVPSVAVWNQAWNYKGLLTAIQFLKRINHPRAAEFAAFADGFKSTFDEAFRAKVATAKTWTDDSGNTHPILPTDLVPAPATHIFDDAFLLDTGPLVLPFSGLMDANDPLMKSFADFFREGPNVDLWGPRSSPIARAILRHEISSCEPCYSWNIVNSAKSGDREKFLEGMYSLFTGAISPQTYINGEHRNAMYGTVFVAPLMTWCLRTAVIDDELAPDELHLLRLAPLAWLSKSEETIFENMPTIYGPVDLRFRLSDSESPDLQVSFKGHWRQDPPKVILHIPPVENLNKVIINGRENPADQPIQLTSEGN